MKPCEKCIFLMTQNQNKCENYLSYLNIGLKKEDITDICKYIQKYKDKGNIQQLCKLISSSDKN